MNKISKKKVRQYSNEFLKFGFIPAAHDERSPFCLLCLQTLTNESMKAGRLENHLKAKHPNHVKSNLQYFKTLKTNFEKRTKITSLFANQTASLNRTLEASYAISLLIAISGKNHTIGEDLLKPAISVFVRKVLQTDDKDVQAMALSNNTVSRRIDEIGQDVELQLIEKLKSQKFSLQIDECTVRKSEALLLAYVRYIDKEKFQEEMLFCQSLETTTRGVDIYNKVSNYFDDNEIPKTNIVSCAADGAPAMMGKNTGCLKLLKDENPNMLVVHCVIHRENLVAKNLAPKLHEILHSAIKCINYIKANAKTERLFQKFCEVNHTNHVRLLLHTEVRWLSKGNCLRRLMELFEPLSEFLKDKSEITLLMTTDGKAYVSYLADTFEKLCSLNKQLQGADATLCDAKAKIFGFVTFLSLCRGNILSKSYVQFLWLKECDVTQEANTVIAEHLEMLMNDFNQRFYDLKAMEFPSWLTQPLLSDLSAVSEQYQQELCELQQDESMKTIFKIKGNLMWLSQECKKKYPRCTALASQKLISFPSSYLVECGFSVVADLLHAKRNQLEITKRGDLRLKLTKLEPRIKQLCRQHQAQGSH